MTTQYADDGTPYDAVRALKIMKMGLNTILSSNYRTLSGDGICVEIREETISDMIMELNKIITDAEAVYAEHAELVDFVKRLNKVVRHYEVED